MAYLDWDYFEEEREANRRWMWNQEHFADTCYVLGIQTFLAFTILSKLKIKDYENDFIEISYNNERDSIIGKIMNCGKPIVRYCFDKDDFDNWVKTNFQWIIKIDEDKYKLNLKQFFFGWDNLSIKEQELLGDDQIIAKRWVLICNMQLDFARMDTNVLYKFGLGFLFD